MRSFIAVLRRGEGGKGFKAPKEFSYHWKPSPRFVSLQPFCSPSNAPSYLRMFPKHFTRQVIYGTVNRTSPISRMVAPERTPEQVNWMPPTKEDVGKSNHLLLITNDFQTKRDDPEGGSPPLGSGALHCPNPFSVNNFSKISSSRFFSTSSVVSQNQAPSEPKPKKGKFNVLTLAARRRKNIPITMLTAYDTPSARLADEAGVDLLLVGDSVAMVSLGQPNTVGVSMETIIHHCKAVVAAKPKYSMVIGDMPFGSYLTVEDALQNATRLLKEGGVDAVKLEGGARVRPMVEALVAAGIVVVGHVGLCPQSAASVGGFRVQGKTVAAAQEVIRDAMEIQEGGASLVVLELIPRELASLITSRLSIPTIGIGAGEGTSGQVLVWHDLLGLYPNPPKFVKQMANIGETIQGALRSYVEEVQQRQFPGPQHSTPLSHDVLRELSQSIDGFEGPSDQDHQDQSQPPTPSGGEEEALYSSSTSSPPSSVDEKDKPVFLSNLSSFLSDATFDYVSHIDPTSQNFKQEFQLFMEEKPVVVIGGGSMGTLFASQLSKVHPVLLLSGYEEHVETMQKGGLWVAREKIEQEEKMEQGQNKTSGRFLAMSGTMIDDLLLEYPNSADLVLILTCGSRTEKAARVSSSLLSPSGLLLTLQNGLGNDEILEQAVGKERVLSGVTSQSAVLDSPGKVIHTGTKGDTVLLAKDPASFERASSVSSLLSSAGFPVRVESNRKEGTAVRWKKLAVNSVINPLTALLNVRNGDLANEELAKTMVPQLTQELSLVAEQTENLSLSPKELEEEVYHVAKLTSVNTSSMLRALREGRAIEIDKISGTIAQMGQACGIPTPMNSLLYSLLKKKSGAAMNPVRAYHSLSSTIDGSNALPLKTPYNVLTSPEEMRKFRRSLDSSKSVGFVPTMGGLHEGHLDLVEAAKSLCDFTIVSLFVNPKQFAEGEDFGTYPRTVEADMKALEEIGLGEKNGALFLPQSKSIYFTNPKSLTYVDVEGSNSHGEGEKRPGFFKGVATICTILFNIVRPDVAVFGQKDGLQCIVLRQITRDLHMGTDIHIIKTKREPTGLAMSTRNQYLSAHQREHVAPKLYEALCDVENYVAREGEISRDIAHEIISMRLREAPELDLEYVTLTDWNTGKQIDDPSFTIPIKPNQTELTQERLSEPPKIVLERSVSHNPRVLLALAAKLGTTRLLDNSLL